MTTGPEVKVEVYLRKQVEKCGGWCLKFAPIIAGAPDRLVMLPGHPLMLVETKAKNGVLNPSQRVWHARALKRGHVVQVISSKTEVDAWLLRLDSQ